MVVYCIKFVLRGESPREKTEPYDDILRSLAFLRYATLHSQTCEPHRSVFFQAKQWKTIPTN